MAKEKTKSVEEIKEIAPIETPVVQRLYRSETNKVIAGVCGGLGEFFNIDPTIIRIVFTLLAFFGGSGLLIYILLWILVPNKSNLNTPTNKVIEGNFDELKNRARNLKTQENSRFFWALFIILLGFLFLFNNFGILDTIELEKYWPLTLIILGLFLIFKR